MVLSKNIEDAKKTPYGIDYWVKFSDGFPNKTHSCVEARARWPQKVIEFLENHVKMFTSAQIAQPNVPVAGMTETPIVVGEPIRISCKLFLSFVAYI